MPFYQPPIRDSSPGYEPSGLTTYRSLNKLELDTLDSTTRSNDVSQVKHTKRPSSPSASDTSYDSDLSDDEVIQPITPPPNLHRLSRYVKRARVCPKPYERDGLNIFERRFVDNQLLQNGPANQVVDVQRGKKILERRLGHLPSEIVPQAVITKNADVEWRRMCALTTAWEIHAREQHLKFLYMLFEDQGETFVDAASEPVHTTLGELVRGVRESSRIR